MRRGGEGLKGEKKRERVIGVRILPDPCLPTAPTHTHTHTCTHLKHAAEVNGCFLLFAV